MNARQRAKRRAQLEPKVAQLKELVAQINFLASQCYGQREAAAEKEYWRHRLDDLKRGGRFTLVDEFLDRATTRLTNVKYRFENPDILTPDRTMTGRFAGKTAQIQNHFKLHQREILEQMVKYRPGDIERTDDGVDAINYFLTAGYGVPVKKPSDVVKLDVT
jgi:hypothetical protein